VLDLCRGRRGSRGLGYGCERRELVFEVVGRVVIVG
jgi:hypothetical protein